MSISHEKFIHFQVDGWFLYLQLPGKVAQQILFAFHFRQHFFEVAPNQDCGRLSRMNLLLTLIALLSFGSSAPPKCPNGQVFYRKQCLACDQKIGPVCTKKGMKHKTSCQLTLDGEAISLDFALIDGECKLICPTDGFAVCAPGGNKFANFCLLVEAGFTAVDTDYFPDPSTQHCIIK